MTHLSDDTPEDLQATEDWLRAQRPAASGHDFDRIARQARVQAARGSGPARTRRMLPTVLSVMALALGAGGAVSLAKQKPPSVPSGPSNNVNAAQTQYKPGKGCGDKNHVHERENECKKPPK